MELILLKIAVFLRPIGSLEYLDAVFEVAGVAIFLLVVVAFLMKSSIKGAMVLTPTDILILAFAVWCASLYVIYPETPRLRALSDLGKATIPLLSYTLVHNIIRDREDYRRLLFWIIVGFSFPTIVSAALILAGKGVYWVSYWTGIPRWRGAYLGPHAMGHSMTLFLMTLVIYGYFLREKMRASGGLLKSHLAILLGIGSVAFFCLVMSQVRSAILGLLCFAGVLIALNNRRLLIVGTLVMSVLAVATVPYWLPWLAPEVVTMEQGKSTLEDLGSSRPKYWLHNLSLYANLPLDQQIAGAGLASRAETMYVAEDEVLDSHNDWLDLLMQTGVVGLALYLAIQLLAFKSALRLNVSDRRIFIALLLSVNLMMFVSNSYVWRIQVGHLYFILLAFIELSSVRDARMAPELLRPTVPPAPSSAGWQGIRRSGQWRSY